MSKKYLRSWGQYDFKDAFGTSIEEYLIRFMNYDTTSIIPDRFPKLEV
jgi:lipid II:glycine glycyltransferase (peptidoglycan interpeptide bridge formation enzyme)